jgi:hypothetical protein
MEFEVNMRRWRRFQMSLGFSIDYEMSLSPFYTDLASNTSVITSNLVTLNESLIDDLRQGRAPVELLRPFVHELTHHCSFNSIVGLALMSLWSSCTPSVVEMAMQSIRPISDLAMVRQSYRLLAPLLEGLAGYAEHDLRAGESNVSSRVVSSTFNLFGRHLLESNAYKAVDFRRLRQSDTWIRQKETLLSEPLKESPYLLGYLAVKALHRRVSTSCRRLKDPDLFLLLMNDFFFGDYQMAILLADLALHREPLRLPEAGAAVFLRLGEHLGRVVSHFQDRIEYLCVKPSELASSCENYFQQHSGSHEAVGEESETFRPSYHNYDRQLAKQLQIAIQLRCAPLFINMFWSGIFEHRTDFRAMCNRVNIRVGNGEFVIHDIHTSKELWRGPHVPLADLGEGEGSIEVILPNSADDVILAILAGDGLVAVKGLRDNSWNDPVLVDRFDSLRSFLVIEGAMHALFERQSVTPGSVSERLVAHYESQGSQAAEHIYLQLACLGGGDRQRLMISLARDGFSSLLNKEQLRLAARVSLFCGSDTVEAEQLADGLQMPVAILDQGLGEINQTTKNAFNFEIFPRLDGKYASQI